MDLSTFNDAEGWGWVNWKQIGSSLDEETSSICCSQLLLCSNRSSGSKLNWCAWFRWNRLQSVVCRSVLYLYEVGTLQVGMHQFQLSLDDCNQSDWATKAIGCQSVWVPVRLENDQTDSQSDFTPVRLVPSPTGYCTVRPDSELSNPDTSLVMTHIIACNRLDRSYCLSTWIHRFSRGGTIKWLTIDMIRCAREAPCPKAQVRMCLNQLAIIMQYDFQS